MQSIQKSEAESTRVRKWPNYVGISSALAGSLALGNAVALLYGGLGFGFRFTIGALNNLVLIGALIVGVCGCISCALAVRSSRAKWSWSLWALFLSLMTMPVLFLLLLWFSGSWTGDDPVREELHSIRIGSDRYVMIRVNVSAGKPFRIRVHRETDLIPGLLVWDSRQTRSYRFPHGSLELSKGVIICRFTGSRHADEDEEVTIRVDD